MNILYFIPLFQISICIVLFQINHFCDLAFKFSRILISEFFAYLGRYFFTIYDLNTCFFINFDL